MASLIVCVYLCALFAGATLNRRTPAPLCDTLQTHTHTETTPRDFCPVIWHIFDVESKKDKMGERAGSAEGERQKESEREKAVEAFHSSERHSLLCAPLQHPTELTQPSLLIHPSSLLRSPSAAPPLSCPGGFFIKCYQKSDWSYSWADGGLAVWLESNSFTGE